MPNLGSVAAFRTQNSNVVSLDVISVSEASFSTENSILIFFSCNTGKKSHCWPLQKIGKAASAVNWSGDSAMVAGVTEHPIWVHLLLLSDSELIDSDNVLVKYLPDISKNLSLYPLLLYRPLWILKQTVILFLATLGTDTDFHFV